MKQRFEKYKPSEKGIFTVSLVIMIPLLVFGTFMIFQYASDMRVANSIDRVIDRAAFAGATKVDMLAVPQKLILDEAQAKRAVVQMIYDNLKVDYDDYVYNADKVNTVVGIPQKTFPLKSIDGFLEIMDIRVINMEPGETKKYYEYVDPHFQFTKTIEYSSVIVVARIRHGPKLVQGKEFEYMYAVEQLRWGERK